MLEEENDLEKSIEDREKELEDAEKEEDDIEDQGEDEEAQNDDAGEDDSDDDAGDANEQDDDSAQEQKDDLGPQERARLRVLEREREDLKRELEEARKSKEPENKKDEDPEPNKEDDPFAWLEWENRQLKSQVSDLNEWRGKQEESASQRQEREQHEKDFNDAVQELGGYIREYTKEKQDTPQVLEHLENTLADSIRMLYPNFNASQVQMAVNQKVVEMASTYYNAGHDPAKALYDLGIQKGYKPKEKKTAADNLKSVAKNKKNSGSPLGKGGKESGSNITLEDYQNMNNAEKMTLSNEELDEIEALLEG